VLVKIFENRSLFSEDMGKNFCGLLFWATLQSGRMLIDRQWLLHHARPTSVYECVCGRPDELETLVERVKQQLRSLAITSSQEPGRIFLGLDMTRAGYVSKDDLRTACIKHNLPCADDLIDCVCSCPTRPTHHCMSHSTHYFTSAQGRLQREVKKKVKAV